MYYAKGRRKDLFSVLLPAQFVLRTIVQAQFQWVWKKTTHAPKPTLRLGYITRLHFANLYRREENFRYANNLSWLWETYDALRQHWMASSCTKIRNLFPTVAKHLGNPLSTAYVKAPNEVRELVYALLEYFGDPTKPGNLQGLNLPLGAFGNFLTKTRDHWLLFTRRRLWIPHKRVWIGQSSTMWVKVFTRPIVHLSIHGLDK